MNAGYVTPELLNRVYRIGNNTGSSSISQSIFATAGQYYSISDLTAFQKRFNLPVQEAIAQNGFSTDQPCGDDKYPCQEG